MYALNVDIFYFSCRNKAFIYSFSLNFVELLKQKIKLNDPLIKKAVMIFGLSSHTYNRSTVRRSNHK